VRMSPGVRKLALTAHVLSSVGWLGAVAAFFALAVVGLGTRDAQLVRAVYLALAPVTWLVIVPLSLTSLLSGLLQSFGTSWGLVRHYWVVFKFVLTVLAVVVLLQQLEPVALLAEAAAQGTFGADDLYLERTSLVVHSGGGLLVLLVPLVLSVYKPRGRTRHGQRQTAMLP
jgi:hypothetical protein